jgi:hypothetical protein
MYCRDTTDDATEHIAQLQLKNYYARLTQITDRSLQILGRMTSLETIEFYETKSVTDAGLAFSGRPAASAQDQSRRTTECLSGRR